MDLVQRREVDRFACFEPTPWHASLERRVLDHDRSASLGLPLRDEHVAELTSTREGQRQPIKSWDHWSGNFDDPHGRRQRRDQIGEEIACPDRRPYSVIRFDGEGEPDRDLVAIHHRVLALTAPSGGDIRRPTTRGMVVAHGQP